MESELFIYDNTNKLKPFRLTSEFYEKYVLPGEPIPFDTIVNAALRNKIIIPAKSSINYVIHILLMRDLNGGVVDKLDKGEYMLFFRYYCGYNITNILRKEFLKETAKKDKAMVYQGYAESGTVRLIIQ
ncbi:MAG: hypothetical protein QM734_15375 [Cyclobacteriaceae bacterium]